MFVRKLFGLGDHLFSSRDKKSTTSAIHASHRHTAKLPSGRRPLRLEPLEDRRMLSVTLHVDDNSAALTPDGLAWDTAYADLQSAMDRAAELNTDTITDNNVDAIWIAEGTYHPTTELDPGDARSASFSLVDNVSLYGGFASTETSLDQRDLSSHVTTLSGDLGVLDDSSDNAYTVVYGSEVSGVTLDSLTITDGFAYCYGGNGWDSYRSDGGGLWVSQGEVTITNSIITKNSSDWNGGGIYCESSNLLLSGSYVLNNASTMGGGILSSDSNLSIVSSVFSENEGHEVGGGIFHDDGILDVKNSVFQGNIGPCYGGAIHTRADVFSVVNSTFVDNIAIYGGAISTAADVTSIINSIFTGNTANYGGFGGAIYMDSGIVSIANSTFIGNVAKSTNYGWGGYGGAIYVEGGDLSIADSTIVGNAADEGGGGVYVESGSASLINSIVSFNENASNGEEDNIAGMLTSDDGSNLIGVDPKFFRNPSKGADNEWGTDDDDYGDLRLQWDSPALDTGDVSLLPNDATDMDGDGDTSEPIPFDLEGKARVQGGSVNMGAYETYYANCRTGPVLYVDQSATPGSGNSVSGWEYAYTDLQEALDQAASLNSDTITDNDVTQIWIAEGTYYPTAELEPGDARSVSFSLVDGVCLYGGFAGTETSLNQRDLSSRITTLSGDLGVLEDSSDNAYTVVYCDENIDAVLDGLAIVGGNADVQGGSSFYKTAYGGGVHNLGSLTILRSTFSDNYAIGGGGIWSTSGAVLTVTDSEFINNTANFGGGICCFMDTAVVANSTFIDNSATRDNGGGYGGGICNYSDDLTVTNSKFINNSANSGGGISNASNLTITNSILLSNSADVGGGIYNYGDNGDYLGNLTVTNSTIAYNFDGSGICSKDSGTTVTLNNTIVAQNDGFGGLDIDIDHESTFSGSYNLIGNGSGQTDLIDGVNGNQVGTDEISIDPGLSPLTQLDNGGWGCFLMVGSPAIDAGSDALALDSTGQPLVEDAGGHARILGDAVNIGAIESVAVDRPAQIYVVTSLENTIANDGILTFREAFEAANRNQPVGDAPAGSLCNQDTIQFANGLSGTILLDQELVILSDLSIEGPGAELITFDAREQCRTFSVHLLASVTLTGITITGGMTEENGGGIRNAGILTIVDVSICENTTSDSGGGIYNAGTLNIVDATISGNTANNGAGLYNVGTLTAVRSTFQGNSASYLAGGIYNDSGIATIANSAILNNFAEYVGGIYSISENNTPTGALTLLNTAIVHNSASQSVGGIYSYNNATTITSSTIAGNSADEIVGGVWLGSTTTLNNTIIAGNTASSYPDVRWIDTQITAGSHNIIGSGSGSNVVRDGLNGNLVGTSDLPIDPMFVDPDTGDYRLRAGSPAVDAGNNALAVDQDGVALEFDLAGNPRIQNGAVDIGAFEGAVADWGTVRLEILNRAGTEQLEWVDEWTGCWVEVWGQGDAAMGIGSFDVEVDFLGGCFTPDMSEVVPGAGVDEGSLNATLDEAEGTLRLEGSMQLQDAGQGGEVMLAKVYFKPAPGDSVLERDTDGHYLSPIADAGFQINRAMLTQEDTATVWPATIQQHDAVPLWPVMYDLNGDSIIDLEDLSQVLTVYRWNVQQSNLPRAWACDFDRSGTVDLRDISLLLTRYRWQKGDGDSINYPNDFPFADSGELVAVSSAGAAVDGALVFAAAEPATISASSTDAVFADDSWNEIVWASVEVDQKAGEDEAPAWWDENLVDLELAVLGDLGD